LSHLVPSFSKLTASTIVGNMTATSKTFGYLGSNVHWYGQSYLSHRVRCIWHDDVYDIMKHDISWFDTSDYAVDNAYDFPLVNKKIPGLMKNENNGAIMTKFVGLRAKMYALRVDGKKDTKKVKGVKSNVIAKSITFDDYTRYLFDETEMTRKRV